MDHKHLIRPDPFDKKKVSDSLMESLNCHDLHVLLDDCLHLCDGRIVGDSDACRGAQTTGLCRLISTENEVILRGSSHFDPKILTIVRHFINVSFSFLTINL